MFEQTLIHHCSPTLAGLKCANLFTFKYICIKTLRQDISDYNEKLNDKDIYITMLKCTNNSALLYVYRKNKLNAILANPENYAFLKEYGYKAFDLDFSLHKLKSYLKCTKSFPHEIGLFLDYPLEDVKAFIKHKGQNSQCTGCWKVYCDKNDATQRFYKFEKCKKVYLKHFYSGKSIMQLAVSA